jgi:hypothetical protein
MKDSLSRTPVRRVIEDLSHASRYSDKDGYACNLQQLEQHGKVSLHLQIDRTVNINLIRIGTGCVVICHVALRTRHD